MNILDEICKNKKIEIKNEKNKYSLNTLEKLIKNKKNRGFKSLLKQKENDKKINIIGEIKKSSPSAGIIVNNYNPINIAINYEKSGVGAISVLTEKKFFNGELDHISIINKNVNIPILRKDFIIDPYQVAQSKFYKADAILLIMSILSLNQAIEILDISKKYEIDCLIEVHNEKEIESALKLNNNLIGINNRNLSDLTVDLNNVKNLIRNIPKDYTVVAESGIKVKNDISLYNSLGIYNFLIGESLLKSKDINKKIKEFTN